MQIYLITDQKKRVHQFIYPDRVWEKSEDGWTTRSLEKQDHADRLAVCRKLVKNAVAGRRLVPSAGVGPQVADTEEDENETVTKH